MLLIVEEPITGVFVLHAGPAGDALLVAFLFVYLFYLSTLLIIANLATLPLAMIATAVIARLRRYKSLPTTVAGSILYVGFVMPWIGMMLSLFQRRQCCWIWILVYILVFLFHFFLCLYLYLWHFHVSDGEVPVLAREFRMRPAETPSTLLTIERYEFLFLLIGALIVLCRLTLHRCIVYYDDQRKCWKSKSLVCWRCVEPLVFFGLWQVHIIVLSFFHNLLVSESLIDLLNWLFNPERPIWGGYLQYAAALAYIVVFAWLLFLVGYGIALLGQRLVGRLRKRDADAG